MVSERLARPASTAVFRVRADRGEEWAVDDGTIRKLILTLRGWSAMIVGELDGIFLLRAAVVIAACGRAHSRLRWRTAVLPGFGEMNGKKNSLLEP
jgi:hypothetical protein